MMKSTTIRIDEELKRDASQMLESLGLSFNTYVVMATRQLVSQKRVPFSLEVPSQSPSELTRKALVEAEARDLGLIEDDSPQFTSTESLLSFLEED